MNTTLLRLMLRRHWLSVTLCCMVPVVIGLVVGLVYPTYSKERALFETFKGIIDYYGQGELEIFTEAGAFSFPFQHPIVLVIYSVLAAIPATALPAGERGTKALDLLLATPLRRKTLILTVAVFGLFSAAAIGITGYLGAWLGATVAGGGGEMPWARLVVVGVNAAALCVFFGATSLLVSVRSRNRGAATMLYGVVIFAFFCADIAARLWREGQWLGRLTPYGYLRPSRIIGANGTAAAGWFDTGVLLVAAVAIYAVAVVLQMRRKSA